MGQISKKFIGTSVRAMGLCGCRVFSEILLQNVLWRSIHIVFAPTLQTKRRADLIVGDGVWMHLLGYCLHFKVWSSVEDEEVSSRAMPAEPSAEFGGYFDHHGCVRKARRQARMGVMRQRSRERLGVRSLGARGSLSRR